MTEIIDDILSDPAVGALGSAIGLAAVALWLAAAWWAYSDATRRTESSLLGFLAAGWVVLSSPLLLPLSLLIYTFARPQISAGDQRSRSLVRELGALAEEGPSCFGCGAAVDGAWLRCPECTTWLAAPCADCSAWSDPRLEICPMCGSEQRATPQVAATKPATPSLLGRVRRGRAAVRAMGPGSPTFHRQANQRVTPTGDGRPLAPARLQRG
ncbi:MAG TPA: hypothetical protein VM451_02485 [Candidatus Limnocylindria bacterium]|nr:hypothetical protein [Candidatus Limnocylindria bacterium]